MLQTLQKFGRAVRRDYLPATYPDGSGPFSKTLAICLGITWGLCLPLTLLFPAVCGWMPILAVGASATIFFDRIREIRKDMKQKSGGEMTAPGGGTVSLSGPGQDVCVIENTQKFLMKISEKYADASEIPARLRKKMAPYVRDSAQAAQSVNAMLENAPQERITFLRHSFNGAPKIAAEVLTPYGLSQKTEADYKAAIAASVAHCRDGLAQPITVKPIRLKRGFLLSYWMR